MKKKTKDFGVFFWIHLAFIITQYASPFLLSWEIVLIGILAMYLQWLIFGNCLLTMAEFNTTSKTASFNHHYLSRMGFTVDRRVLAWYTGAVLPGAVLLFSMLWQVVLHHPPLLF